MSLKGGTICSKHDKITDSASEIRKMIDELTTLANAIDSAASDIDYVVSGAKDDGQRMENELDAKRKRIEDLESDLESMEKDRDYWKDRAEGAESELTAEREKIEGRE